MKRIIVFILLLISIVGISSCDKKVEKESNDNNKIIIVDEENCLDYLDLPNKNAIKIIADEACMEEMVLIVRKGFERKKISFDVPIIANIRDKEASKRLITEKFTLRSGKYRTGQDYYLVLADMDDESQIHQRYKFTIDIAEM